MFIEVLPWLNGRVRKRKEIPVALTIAGSDSGGGAGVQADLKTFAALDVHGTSAITCVTAQTPGRVSLIEPCSTWMVRAQLTAVFKELTPQAAKTGMLYSREIIRLVARWFREHPCPLVVDPVMIATSGARLLEPDAVEALAKELLPLAILSTPNVPEAEALLAMKIRAPEDLRTAARRWHQRFSGAVLVKGGHLAAGRESLDLFYDGNAELLLSARRVRGVKTHGTGCTYAAAITAHLARGKPLGTAVQLAKQFVTAAIDGSRRVREFDVLNHRLAGP